MLRNEDRLYHIIVSFPSICANQFLILKFRRNEAICCLIGFSIGIGCCLMYRWIRNTFFGLSYNHSSSSQQAAECRIEDEQKFSSLINLNKINNNLLCDTSWSKSKNDFYYNQFLASSSAKKRSKRTRNGLSGSSSKEFDYNLNYISDYRSRSSSKQRYCSNNMCCNCSHAASSASYFSTSTNNSASNSKSQSQSRFNSYYNLNEAAIASSSSSSNIYSYSGSYKRDFEEPLNDVYQNLAKFLSKQFCKNFKLRRSLAKNRHTSKVFTNNNTTINNSFNMLKTNSANNSLNSLSKYNTSKQNIHQHQVGLPNINEIDYFASNKSNSQNTPKSYINSNSSSILRNINDIGDSKSDLSANHPNEDLIITANTSNSNICNLITFDEYDFSNSNNNYNNSSCNLNKNISNSNTLLNLNKLTDDTGDLYNSFSTNYNGASNYFNNKNLNDNNLSNVDSNSKRSINNSSNGYDEDSLDMFQTTQSQYSSTAFDLDELTDSRLLYPKSVDKSLEEALHHIDKLKEDMSHLCKDIDTLYNTKADKSNILMTDYYSSTDSSSISHLANLDKYLNLNSSNSSLTSKSKRINSTNKEYNISNSIESLNGNFRSDVKKCCCIYSDLINIFALNAANNNSNEKTTTDYDQYVHYDDKCCQTPPEVKKINFYQTKTKKCSHRRWSNRSNFTSSSNGSRYGSSSFLFSKKINSYNYCKLTRRKLKFSNQDKD